MTEATAVNAYESGVDTKIAAAYDMLSRADSEWHSASDSLHYAINDKKVYKNRTNWTWRLSEAEAREKLADRRPNSWEKTNEYYTEKLDAARAKSEAVKAEIAELGKLYTGWSRFFIVPGGHIHSSRNCSTCYATTMFGWLPALSGLTERDAVSAHGPLLCSVCFPSAPVEWTVEPQSDKTFCAGSGETVKAERGRYVKCPVCGKVGALTPRGQVRKHS